MKFIFSGRVSSHLLQGVWFQLFIMIKRCVMTKEVIMLLIRQQQLLLLLFYFFRVCKYHLISHLENWNYALNFLLFSFFASSLVGVAFHRRIPAPLFLLSCQVGKYCRQLFHFHFVFLRLVFLSFTWNNDCINVGGRRRNMSATRPLWNE